MSVCWISTFSEPKKRAVSFVTVTDPINWIGTIKKMAFVKGVDDIEIFRYSSDGITCYDLTVFISFTSEESEEQTLAKLFTPQFIQEHLPISKPNELGVFKKIFARVAPSTKVSPIKDQPLCPNDLKVIYETIDVNNNIGIYGMDCYKEYQTLSTEIKQSLFEPIHNYKEFNDLAKTHKIGGGSWLVMPRSEYDPNNNKCRRYFEQIMEQFVHGSLCNSYIDRITYSCMKALVKVTNKHTIYFDFVASHPNHNDNDEQAFLHDREVRETFYALYKMDLRASLKYKPDVFTACKLNTRNTAARLTFYSQIHHLRKLELAKMD